MAPPRPYWKGYLKLSLVSCPIALYTATSSGERVAFRQINKKTGNRLRQQLVDEETGEPIDPDDKGRGYEVDKGVYLRVEDEDIDAIAIESSHTIDIDSFVPKAEIDERYVDSPYYLIPENKVALEAFAVIRDAMRDKSMVALGRVVLSKRERVIMLQPRGKGLLDTEIPLRGSRRGDLFRRHRRGQDSERHACARRAHPRDQGGAIRRLKVPRPL
jgi:DNA end-binding protein Ku